MTRATGPRVFAASVGLYSFVLLTAMLLERRYHAVLVTRTSGLALAWLSVGPWLIRDSVRLSRDFLESYRPLFPDEHRWSSLLGAHTQRLLFDWLWFGVPWSLLTTGLVVTALYPDARGPVLLWVMLSFGALFLMSGVGFWGVVTLVRLIREFADSGVTYQPYHPDHFGGMAATGTFAARAALYFSSGALVLPLAFDIIRQSPGRSPSTILVLASLLTTTFVVFVVAAFVLPVLEIKRLADTERVRVMSDARTRLDRLLEAYARRPAHDEHLLNQVSMCYQMEYGELSKLRPYPYDLKAAAELILAVAVPVAVVVLEAFLR